MNQYEEKISDCIETIENTEYFSEFVNEFVEIRNWAEKEDFMEYAKLAQYEIEICSIYIKSIPLLIPNEEERFVSHHTYTNGSQWPDINKFTQDQYDYYEKRLLGTDNVFLRYRYSDFLYENHDKVSTNKYLISQYLLKSLEFLVRHYHTNNNDIQYLFVLARMIEVSLLMNNEKSITEAISMLIEILTELKLKEKYTWIPGMRQVFLGNL